MSYIHSIIAQCPGVTENLISLAVRMSIVSTVRMPAAAARTLNLLVLLRRPHPSAMQVNSTARTCHCNGDVLALLNLPLKNRPHLTSLEARWPAQQASRNARCFAPFVRECISMATLVCAHGTANLTNHGPSELVEERIFHALRVRTRTI